MGATRNVSEVFCSPGCHLRIFGSNGYPTDCNNDNCSNIMCMPAIMTLCAAFISINVSLTGAIRREGEEEREQEIAVDSFFMLYFSLAMHLAIGSQQNDGIS